MNRKKKRLITVILIALLLVGCGGIEPEDRAYPLALIVDYDSDSEMYELEFSMADLSQITGQGKSDDPQEKKREELAYQAKSLEKIVQEYRSSQEYFLDLGHVQAIFLGPGILEQKTQTEELIRYLVEQPVLGRNAAVFTCTDPVKLMQAGEKLSDSLGEYLSGIYENYPENQRWEPVTLGDVFYTWYENKKIPKLPEVWTDGEEIKVVRP